MSVGLYGAVRPVEYPVGDWPWIPPDYSGHPVPPTPWERPVPNLRGTPSVTPGTLVGHIMLAGHITPIVPVFPVFPPVKQDLGWVVNKMGGDFLNPVFYGETIVSTAEQSLYIPTLSKKMMPWINAGKGAKLAQTGLQWGGYAVDAIDLYGTAISSGSILSDAFVSQAFGIYTKYATSALTTSMSYSAALVVAGLVMSAPAWVVAGTFVGTFILAKWATGTVAVGGGNLWGHGLVSTASFVGNFAYDVLHPTQQAQTFLGKMVGNAVVATGRWTGDFINNLFDGPQHHIPTPAASQPQVGGVLFDKCATLTGTSPEITGAYWDSDRGVLVLLGPDNGASDLALSGLEFDHLMVALKAALAGEHIGVSIDPSSEYRDGILSGQFPPAGTPMYVSYLGNTDGTLFGAIMFEADRVMKCLSKGTDNVTGRPLRATKVPGYGSLFDLFNKFGSGGSGSWFRFWFVIDKVEITHDPSAKAFRFGEVKIKVLNETETHGSKAPTDPASAAFASHLTDHYDEYADEFPIFARLREIAKLSALSRYLVNQGAALDPQTIYKQQALSVATPKTTPGICVSAPSSIGSMSIFGGVSMDVLPTIVSRDDKLARLTRDLAQSASPGDFASTWRFKGPDGPVVASSIRLGGVDKPYQTKTSSDHTFKKSWNNTIRSIQRYYDSSVPGGDFGPGWWLYLPYRLQVIPAGRKRPEVLLQSEKSGDENPSVVVLHNFIKPGTRIYRRSDKSATANGLTYCLVSQQSFVKGGISYSLNESDRILFKNGRYFYSSGKYTFIFNEKGQPCEIKLQDGTMAIYTWDEDILKKIYLGGKHSYEFDYDQTTLHTRISSIKVADGTILNYTYNDVGLLSDCFQGKSLKVNYRYDQGMRVSEFRDASGAVVKRKVYDSAGNLLDGALQTVAISDNSRIKLEFTNGKLSSVEDGAGSKSQFSYRKDNSLASVAGSISGYEEWKLDYDEDGKVIGSKDNMGVYTNFYYEPDGQVGRIESDNGLWVQFPDSGSRNPEIKGEHPVWGEWSVGLDNQGLIRNITDAEQNQIQFRYKKQKLKSIKSPGLNVNVVQSNGVSEFRMTGELGIKRRFMHDTYADKIELTVNGPHKEEQHLYIDETHYKLTDIAGQAEYKFDDSELTCEAVFQF